MEPLTTIIDVAMYVSNDFSGELQVEYKYSQTHYFQHIKMT